MRCKRHKTIAYMVEKRTTAEVIARQRQGAVALVPMRKGETAEQFGNPGFAAAFKNAADAFGLVGMHRRTDGGPDLGAIVETAGGDEQCPVARRDRFLGLDEAAARRLLNESALSGPVPAHGACQHVLLPLRNRVVTKSDNTGERRHGNVSRYGHEPDAAGAY